jgi:hypothetical protein
MQRLRLRSQGDGGLPKARGVGGGPMRQLGNGWYPIEIKDSISPSVGKKRPCNQCCPADSDSVNLGSNPGPPANNGLLISLAFLGRVDRRKAGHQGQTAHSGTHGSRHNSDVAVESGLLFAAGRTVTATARKPVLRGAARFFA